MKKTTEKAYWFNGAAYCCDCAESDTPCMSEAERERAVLAQGQGRCGCCGKSFETDDTDR